VTVTAHQKPFDSVDRDQCHERAFMLARKIAHLRAYGNSHLLRMNSAIEVNPPVRRMRPLETGQSLLDHATKRAHTLVVRFQNSVALRAVRERVRSMVIRPRSCNLRCTSQAERGETPSNIASASRPNRMDFLPY
jgi:hypothetical protein